MKFAGHPVAVTGGAGFVGRHLVQRLCDLGAEVTVIDLRNDGLTDLFGVQFVRADLRSYSEAVAALSGADLVFHLAANASGTLSVEKPWLDFEMNALATSNVGNAALAAGAQRLVYLSAGSVYGTPQEVPLNEEHPTRPFLPYGASKLSGELALRALHTACGLPVVIGRGMVVYGPGEDPRSAGGEVSQFLRWHLNGLPIPVVGDIDRKTRDFIHVHDLVNALLAMADKGCSGGIYNVGSGTETSMRQLAEEISAATGRPAQLDANPEVNDDSYRLVANISRLRGIGFEPQITLGAGLRSLSAELGGAPELPSVKAIFRMQRPGAQEVKEKEAERAGN